jgi:hypothetical protein
MTQDTGQEREHRSLRGLLRSLPRRSTRPGFEAELQRRISAGEIPAAPPSRIALAFRHVPAFAYTFLVVIIAGFLAYYIYFPTAAPPVQEDQPLKVSPGPLATPPVPELRQGDHEEPQLKKKQNAAPGSRIVNRPAGGAVQADKAGDAAPSQFPAAKTAPQRGIMSKMNAVENAIVNDSLAKADSLRRDSLRMLEQKPDSATGKKARKPG